MPVSQFGVLLGDLSLPVDYLMKFHEGAAWALKRALTSGINNFRWFFLNSMPMKRH
jgi:hypothetical protein